MPTTAGSPRLDFIELSRILPNRINPRGPNVRENDPHRENLKESVAQFGILVPLVVRPTGTDKFELIDGERRFWVARSLKMERVPAYVIESGADPEAILQRMFQIHMNRDQWDAVQQCRASEEFYAGLVSKYGNDSEALISEFANFTGNDLRTARNRVQFLRWPKEIKEEIYRDPGKHDSYWYVVEIEDKIVDPALRNFPEYFNKVPVDDVRRFLYRKWEASTIGAAVDVRQVAVMTRSKIEGATRRKKVFKILDKLVHEVDYSYNDAYQEFARQFPSLVEPKLPRPKALINWIRSLSDVLAQYEPQYLEAYRAKAPSLEDLVTAVRDLVDTAHAFLKKMRS